MPNMDKDKINIFNINVCITKLDDALEKVKCIAGNENGYICLPDAYVIVTAQKNKKLQKILNQSLYTFPDGQPLIIYSKLKGIKNISSVSGYHLVRNLLQTELTHYFYGSSTNELKKIKHRLNKEYPHAKILGYKSPPFVSLNEIETHQQIINDLKEINKLQPNLLWVGLNSPKQDYLMFHHHTLLKSSILIGIGGVYDYLSGSMKISPEWIKKLSLRWVYRIIQNPKRIYKKAFIAIFGFSILYFKDFFNDIKKSR